MGAAGDRPGLKSAVEFFKREKGFSRLLTEMSNMYARHGRAFGAVRLTSPTSEEERALSSFFERDYFDQALIRISLGDFERQLVRAFSAEIKLSEFFAEYAGRDTSSTLYKNKDAFTDMLYKKILPKYESTQAASWVSDVAAHMRRTYKPWVEQYANEPDKVLDMIDNVAALINHLPAEASPIQLSDFAARFTNSPYTLDFNGEHSALFLRALAHRFNVAVPYSIEESIGLYLKAGLLTCGVLCQVAVLGLDENAARVLTLENVVQLRQAKAHGGEVFIIENPLVFASVCERLRDVKCTLVSPMGSHNPAFIWLLELFCASGCNLHYAGNIDYKGLIQADKLYLKFGKQFVPWRYAKADYELIIAQNSNLLPDERKDLAMHNEDLALMLSQMRKTGKVASSMPLVPHLAEDIRGRVLLKGMEM